MYEELDDEYSVNILDSVKVVSVKTTCFENIILSLYFSIIVFFTLGGILIICKVYGLF